MSPLIGIGILCLVLVVFVWIAVSKASDDGLFTSLCTGIVLFSAYQFARLEWSFFFLFLRDQGMNHIQAVSTAYWLGFLIVVGPGLVAARLLAKPKVPFPHPMEQYGSMLIGAFAGIVLFAAVIQWLLHADLLPQAFMTPLRTFSPIFHLLGYRVQGFD